MSGLLFYTIYWISVLKFEPWFSVNVWLLIKTITFRCFRVLVRRILISPWKCFNLRSLLRLTGTMHRLRFAFEDFQIRYFRCTTEPVEIRVVCRADSCPGTIQPPDELGLRMSPKLGRQQQSYPPFPRQPRWVNENKDISFAFTYFVGQHLQRFYKLKTHVVLKKIDKIYSFVVIFFVD